MEKKIFKIKVSSSLDPRGLYPSEKRYSASNVMGLSVVSLILTVLSLIMAALIYFKSLGFSTNNDKTFEIRLDELTTTDMYIENGTKFREEIDEERLSNLIERDLMDLEPKFPLDVFIGCLVVALGNLASGITGILAWKRWYIDKNITWYCIAAFQTAVGSFVALAIIVCWFFNKFCNKLSEEIVSVRLAIFILILTTISFFWALLATKIAYRGMRSDYPDDIFISKYGGRVQVNTVKKGNLKSTVIPPDLSHIPASRKFTKYLVKRENGGMPKDESQGEYQDRLNKFLSGGEEENRI